LARPYARRGAPLNPGQTLDVAASAMSVRAASRV